MNWQQVNKYCNNEITRLDTFVLCKLCTVLKCNIQDLLEFIPAATPSPEQPDFNENSVKR